MRVVATVALFAAVGALELAFYNVLALRWQVLVDRQARRRLIYWFWYAEVVGYIAVIPILCYLLGTEALSAAVGYGLAGVAFVVGFASIGLLNKAIVVDLDAAPSRPVAGAPAWQRTAWLELGIALRFQVARCARAGHVHPDPAVATTALNWATWMHGSGQIWHRRLAHRILEAPSRRADEGPCKSAKWRHLG